MERNNLIRNIIIVTFFLFTSLANPNQYAFGAEPEIKTVKIGYQIWMSENLNASAFRNGDLIAEAKTDEEWEKALKENRPAWCYYVNDQNNGLKYGKLYNRFAIIDPRGLAPSGYHIPSESEWDNLYKYLNSDPRYLAPKGEIIGEKIRSTTGWVSDCESNNQSGFSCLPGGYRDREFGYSSITYKFRGKGEEACFYDTNGNYVMRINCRGVGFNRDCCIGVSVRCIKDNSESKALGKVTNMNNTSSEKTGSNASKKTNAEIIAEMSNDLQNEPPPPPPPLPGEPRGPFVKKSADNLALIISMSRDEKKALDNLTIIIGRDGKVFLKMDNDRDTTSHFRAAILDIMFRTYKIAFTPIELRIFELNDSPFGVSIHDMKSFLATNNVSEREKYEKGIPYDNSDNQLFDWLKCAVNLTPAIRIQIDAKDAPNFAIAKVKYLLDELSKVYSTSENVSSSQEVVVVEQKENEVFVVVEEMPEFPGGVVALRQYLQNTKSYPAIAKENGIQGKVYVNFVVEKDGSVSNIKIARAVDTSLDKEALRVVATLPKWKPGKQRGAPVRVSYTVPVNFILE